MRERERERERGREGERERERERERREKEWASTDMRPQRTQTRSQKMLHSNAIRVLEGNTEEQYLTLKLPTNIRRIRLI